MVSSNGRLRNQIDRFKVPRPRDQNQGLYLETDYVEEAARRRGRDETAAIMHLAQIPPAELLLSIILLLG